MNGIIPYAARASVLGNGLKLILMPMPSNGLVAYWTIVRTGSGQEYEPGRSGFAHFFEHMMFRGTERYPSEVYQAILTRIGADANAFTTDDLTAYHASLSAEDLGRVIELESDRFKNLAYSEDDFKTEAGAVYGEYRKSRTEPFFALYEGVLAAAFKTHPYGHTTLGYEADIAAMPEMYAYSRTFFAHHYRPDNSIVFIAGDFDENEAARLVEKHYGDWHAGYRAPPVPEEPLQQDERRVEVTYDGRALPVLWLAYKLDRFDPHDGTRVAADLLAELTFGPASDAYRQLVLEEQAVELLHASANANRDPSLFDIYARIKDPARIDHVLGVIDSTVARFRDAPPGAERLAGLQSRERYDFLMDLDTPDAAAERFVRFIALAGGLDGIEALYASYAAIAPRDVQAAAEAYLTPERRTIGILHPSPQSAG